MLAAQSEQIFSYLREGRSIKEFLGLGEALLQTPLLFCDPGHMHREFSPSYPHDDIKERFRFFYEVSPEEFDRCITQRFSQVNGNLPFIVHTPTFSRRHMISKACWSGRYVGYLLLPETSVPLEELDVALVARLADACAIAGALELGATLIENDRPSAYILNDLIAGRITSPKSLEDRLHGSFLSRRMDYRLVSAVCLDRSCDRPLLNSIATGLHHRIERCRVFFDDGRLFFLMEGEFPTGGQLEKLRELHERHGFAFGVSDGFADLWLLSESHRQACCAARFCTPNEGWLRYYDDCKILDALSCIPAGRRPFLLSSAYCQMKAADESGGTGYVETVAQFLRHDANLARTSQALFVHKNTLLYRFKRIKALFGLDVERLQDLGKFYLSYCLDTALPAQE